MSEIIAFKPVSQEQLRGIVSEFSFPKPVFSNYYNNHIERAQCVLLPDTLVIRSQYDSFNRVYFLSRNGEELESVLRLLDKKDTINCPARNEINESLMKVLSHSGYQIDAIYERMNKTKNEDCEEFNGQFAVKEDLDGIISLLYETFNPIYSHLPDREELLNMIMNNQILVNYDANNIVNGLIMWSIDGKVCNFHAWTSKAPGNESLSLFFEAFNYIESRGVHRSTLWVNETNTSAKSVYEMMGYQKDGLKDYIFVKG